MDQVVDGGEGLLRRSSEWRVGREARIFSDKRIGADWG